MKTTTRETDALQIIIAWTDGDTVVVRERRTDLGERPEMKAVRRSRTVVWLNKGTVEDVEKARAYAAPEGYKVFTYPQTVKDARAAAARDVLAT